MEKQQKILDQIPSDILEKQLSKARFVKETENGHNHIYIFSGKDCPELMIQVGILRELSFRNGGGGTGLPVDIDRYDEFVHADYPDSYADKGFKQLILWDPETKEIIGGYRFALMKDFISADMKSIDSPTMELFDCSPTFITQYAPFTLELGRSFVQPKYQSRADHSIDGAFVRKAMFALDNLFDGLGTLVIDYKSEHVQYFFGKVTMYKTYNRQARNMILYYMDKHFPDYHRLITPKPGLIPHGLNDEIHLLHSLFNGLSEKDDKKILLKSLREIKEGMPPLFKKYTEMSPTMNVFGTAINHHCGDVEETAILIKMDDIVEEYKKKYITRYLYKKFSKFL